MTNRITNKKGVGFLAVVMVFAISFAGIALTASDDVCADTFAASIGDATYNTFEEAITNATDGSTITLLQNINTYDIDVLDKGTITIDGQSDYSLTLSSGNNNVLGNVILTDLTLDSANAILFNGTVTNVSVTLDGVVVKSDAIAYSMAEFTAKDCTFEKMLQLQVHDDTSKFLIDNTTINELNFTKPGIISVGTSGQVELKNDVRLNKATVYDGQIAVDNCSLKVDEIGFYHWVHDGVDEVGDGSFVLGENVNLSPNEEESITVEDGAVASSTSISDDSLGLKNYLENDFTVSKKAFLADDLIVKGGVTLTIASTGTFDLNGHKLILYGNLVVANGGIVNAAYPGSESQNVIQIMKTGTISNEGIIGKGSNNVVVAMGTVEGSYTGAGNVSMKNVNGISFGTKKTIETDSVKYTLTITGTVYKNGVGDAVVEADGVIIASDMTIGTDVLFIGTDVEIAKNVTFTLNGSAGGDVFINAGALVQFNGKTVGEGLTVRGYSETIGAGVDPTKEVGITVENANGVAVYAVSETYMDGSAQKTKYTMHMSGTPVFAGNAGTEANITTTSDADTDPYVYVDGELAFNSAFVSKMGTSTFSIPLMVSGKVTYPTGLTISNYKGTAYAIQTDSTSSMNVITTFDAAFGVIDTTVGKRISVRGDLDLTKSYELAAKQTIVIDDGTRITVKSTGSLTVAKEAIVQGSIHKVEGIVTVIYGGNATVNTFDVKTVATNGDVTFSGILIAIENAQPGQTISIEGQAQVTDASLTIPEGVKVVVGNAASLIVSKDLIVNGELVNNNTVSTKNLKVSGKVDATTGTLTVTEKIGSTGEIILPAGELSAEYNGKINGAVYKNSDNYNVITTVAKAAEASAAMDIPVPVDVYGEVTEDSAVTSKNVIINIMEGAKVSITEITIEEASVIIAGTFSGKISGQSGTDGSTVTSTVVLTQISKFTVSNGSSIGTDGVTKWKTSVKTTDTGSELNGKACVDSGSITLVEDLDVNKGGEERGELIVTEGATLAIDSEKKLTSTKGVSIYGTLEVSGTFEATDASISGELLVKKNGTVEVTEKLDVDGTVTVESDGTMTVTGALTLGKAPATLGTGASVSGAIEIGTTGYIVAYPETQISASDLNEGEAVSTELIINGYTYATVYGEKNGTTSIFGTVFVVPFNITGLDMTPSATLSNWKTDESLTTPVTNDSIGKNAKIYFSAKPALVDGKISVGTGLALYIDGLSIDNFEGTDNKYKLEVGTHTVTYSVLTGYDGTNAKITFNGQTVGSDGKITVTAEMAEFVLTINGATPASTVTPVPAPITPASDDDMGLTEYLLIILVILAAILVIVVAIRMMRS